MAGKRTGTRSQTLIKMHEIARWQMLSKPVDEIAMLMGMTADGVADIIRKRDYQDLLRELQGETYKEVDTAIKNRRADTMLQEASADAAQALIELLDRKEVIVTEGGTPIEVPPSSQDTRLAATAILDRAGFGPIQRRIVKQRMELDPMLEKMFRSAIRESQVIEAEIIEDNHALTDGSED